jgi:hypothetical protein
MGASLARVVMLALVVLPVLGCERGCLARKLGQNGAEPSAGRGGPSAGRGEPSAARTEGTREGSGVGARPGQAQPFDLSGSDCSDGLLRCIDGRVEASRTAHLPHPCGGAKRGERPACECPWEAFAPCPSGCALEGFEVIGSPSDAGAAQLCRASQPVARPILPGDAIPTEVCSTEGVACVDGIVRTCEARGQTVRAVAVCLHGCQPYVGIDDQGDPGASKNLDGVVAILCRRDDAERR